MDFDYDRRGRPTQVVDGIGTQTMDYNAPGHLTGHQYISGQLNGISVASGYDNLFRRSSLSAQSQGSGLLTSVSYGYDAASRLQTVSTLDPHAAPLTATYNYHLHSGLVSNIVFAASGTVKMTTTKRYDNLNRLAQISHVKPDNTPVSAHTYLYNTANQRTKVTLADGSYWVYQYDDLGQVISGKKFWPDTSEVAGQQFGYGFDDIGNRVSTDTNGRPASYSPNNLNQYTQRTVPGAVDVIGSSEPDATVTVNNMATQRKGEYFHKELSVLNLATAQHSAISVVGVRKNAGPGGTDIVTEETGHAFVPKTPEFFQHDPDGNLTQDGRWIYTWDAENRLIAMETVSGLRSTVPGRRLEFAYDHQSRRVSKRVYEWDGSSFILRNSSLFVYDGWNLIAELTEVSGQMSVVRSHVWGLDLSGTEQGAGGVGGLLFTTSHLPLASSHFACFDGNGNVSALVDTATGTRAAAYEYDPFGNTISATGTAVEANVFRFSTKYCDTESALYYYGYRYYQPITGRWLNRDPINEYGGHNLYSFGINNSISVIDVLGMISRMWRGSISEKTGAMISANGRFESEMDFPKRVEVKCSRYWWHSRGWGVEVTQIPRGSITYRSDNLFLGSEGYTSVNDVIKRAESAVGPKSEPEYAHYTLRDHEWYHASAFIAKWNDYNVPSVSAIERKRFSCNKDCEIAKNYIQEYIWWQLAIYDKEQELWHRKIDTPAYELFKGDRKARYFSWRGPLENIVTTREHSFQKARIEYEAVVPRQEAPPSNNTIYLLLFL